MKRMIYAAVATCVVGTLGTAQMVRRPPMSAAQCQAAAQALAEAPTNAWKWSQIAECGQVGASALALALDAAHAQSDSLFLQTILFAASRVRGTAVGTASLALAADRSATVYARLVGMLITVSQRDVGMTLNTPSWAHATTVPGCRISRSTEDARWAADLGTDPGYVAAAAYTLSTISVDATEPAVVREFARCLRNFWSDIPQAINPALITFDYVCGTKFRVGNGDPHRVVVEFRLFHGTERGNITVPANREAFIITHNVYGLEIPYQGQQVRWTRNGGTTCPP